MKKTQNMRNAPRQGHAQLDAVARRLGFDTEPRNHTTRKSATFFPWIKTQEKRK